MAQKAVRGQDLSWREFDWLMSGIDIDQPKPSKQSKDTWISAKILHRKIRKFPVNSAFFRAISLVEAPFLV